MRERLRAGPAGWAGVILLLVEPTDSAAPQGRAGDVYVSEAGNYRVRMAGKPTVQQQALSASGPDPAGPRLSSPASGFGDRAGNCLPTRS